MPFKITVLPSLLQLRFCEGDAEVKFKARLDGALSSLIEWKVGLDWVTFKGPFQPQRFYDLGMWRLGWGVFPFQRRRSPAPAVRPLAALCTRVRAQRSWAASARTGFASSRWLHPLREHLISE